MDRRNVDPEFTEKEIEEQDPLGEQAFAEDGFLDGADGGPAFNAEGLGDGGVGRQPGGEGQKVAGAPEEEQHQVNTPSGQRPDSGGVVIRERGGASKGDPAVGGTRPE